MKTDDEIIARIRAARKRISAKLDHDPANLPEYCRKLDEKFRKQRNEKPTPKTATN